MSNDLTPATPTASSPEALIQRAEEVSNVFRQLNIREAVTHSGARYKHDPATGTEYVAADGACVILRKHTVTLTTARPHASLDGVLAETASSLTQSLQGAMTGVSQSTVSRRRKAR